MPSAPRSGELLRRLERTVADAMRLDEPVPIAFSAGLGSTVIAALARKRAEVRCIVAGTASSPDVRAAAVAKDYMDYRVETVILDRGDVERILSHVRGDHPRLTPREGMSLVPAWAARERAGRTILAGFGFGAIRPAIRDVLGGPEVSLPIASAAHGAAVSRATLRTIARQLGLPRAFAELRRRAPMQGSGIDELLHGTHP